MGSAAKLCFIVVLLCFAVSSAQNLTTFTGTYGPFNETIYSEFQFVDEAYISNGALQLTPDVVYPGRNKLLNQPLGTLQDRSGRVMLKQSFKLWDYEINHNYDNGRVASFNSSFLINAYAFDNITAGEGLAFVVASDLGIPSRSYGQTRSDFTSSGSSTTESRKFIEVYMEEQVEWEGQTPPRAPTPVLKADLDLRGVVAQHSYFGFSGSTGSAVQLNCIGRWNLTVEYYPEDKNPPSRKIPILGIGVGVGGVLVVGAVVLGYYLVKKRGMAQPKRNIIVALKRLPGTPREFKFGDLKKATNNFDEKNKLGQGGFGVVYRGYLKKENQEVAVKWFSRETIKGQDDFLAELTIINRLRHKHLVPLLGWCHMKGKLLLVYDYMQNGSLDRHLFGRGADDKPLRDFGLARALENEKTSYTEAEGVAGTLGYIAPRMLPQWQGHPTVRRLRIRCSLVGGRLLEAVEERLGDEYVVEEAEKVLLLALACSHPIAGERPKTQEIVRIISSLVPVPYVPPFKPAFTWPSVPMGEEDSSLANTRRRQCPFQRPMWGHKTSVESSRPLTN
ncbi:concanavalin A-like lectin protein kinase family protein [Actinidia rufa]|uniref:Concanavalin A-like lectin protein kinase family protein n=1 Tax=Actinidia rufa TaxID=165716 RepID=A0A7J0DQX7_9ERIC|nr:concanavalin A-like lectin protein kinase family protein [Actinidia rufa]